MGDGVWEAGPECRVRTRAGSVAHHLTQQGEQLCRSAEQCGDEEKVAVLREITKCGTETGSELLLLANWH